MTGTATQTDIYQLRADLTAVNQMAQRTRAETEALATQNERRAREQAAADERQRQALTQRIDALATTVSALTTRLDELTARLDAMSRQSRAVSPAPTAKPSAPPSGPPSAPAPTSPPPATGATVRPSTNALQPDDIYQAAYIDFSKGSYALAIAGFREFLRRFPTHQLAGNAQYWIGEANFSLARAHTNDSQTANATQALEQAVVEFRKVVANYPRGEKAPTAIYKEALALIELKQIPLAQTRLQYLVDNFPQAEETLLARERLKTLKPS